MPKEIAFSAEEKKRLQSLGISIIYLFGSQAEGVAGNLSDFDFGVVLKNAQKLSLDTNPLYLELFEILSHYVPGDRLDIVFLQKAPLELRFDVICHGKPVFENRPDIHLDFEEGITQAYCDFKPILKEFDRSVIENQ